MFRWFRKKKEPEPHTLKIWCVVEGPFLQRDLPDEGYPDDAVMLVLKLEDDGDVFDAEVWMDDMQSAYHIIKHFKTNITPLVIEMGSND